MDGCDRAGTQRIKDGWHVVEIDRTHAEDKNDPHVATITGEDPAT